MREFARSFAIGLVFAIGGLSYALATSPSAGGWSVDILSRGIGSALTFTTPFLPGTLEHDLGDAAFGSQIVRWVQAQGGVAPYSFTSDKSNANFMGTVSLAGAITNMASTYLPASDQPDNGSEAQLLLTGRLQGQIGNLAGASLPNGITSLPLQFDVTVVDSKGDNPNKKTESFQITMVNSNVFKFAQTSLNDALTYRDYFDKVEVIGGTAPYTFSLGLITLTSATGAITTFTPATLNSGMGLFLNTTTGMLTGRPLQAGTLQMALTCTDANGNVAQSRGLSTTGQTISLNVLPNTNLSSQFFSTAIAIKGNTVTTGKDWIQYSGIINIGDKVSTLNGAQVTFMIGNYTAPVVTLNARGQGTTGQAKTRSAVNQPNLAAPLASVTISSSNQIKITVTNESFGRSGSILPDIMVSEASLPVTIIISNTSFISSELLKFGVEAKYPKFQNNFLMTYKFGSGNLGGGFLLTGVQGKDDKAGDGDFWKAGFIFLPPDGQSLIAAKSATVGIGSAFTNSISVTSSNGIIGTSEKRGNGTPQIVKIGISSQGKGFVQTSSLPIVSTAANTATSILTAAMDNGNSARFPLVITLNDVNGNEVFGGENALAIFSNGKSWQNSK